MKLSIKENDKKDLLKKLGKANLKFQKMYPGDKPDRQPVHTVYGGANLFSHDTAGKMSKVAVKNLTTYAPDFTVLAKVLKLTGHEHLPTKEKDAAALVSTMNALGEAERRRHYAWLPHAVY